MTHPYRYLVAAAGAADLIDDLCAWHDRMVAHVRRHGAQRRACDCDSDACPAAEATWLWDAARRAFGQDAAALTFLRRHAEAAHD